METVSLKEHLESRIDAIERRIQDTKNDLEHRLHGMNEIRNAMRDQSSQFVTRKEILTIVVAVVSLLVSVLIAVYSIR